MTVAAASTAPAASAAATAASIPARCDDGNTESGDGCSATCTSECGDGVVERGEECDDGNRTDGDGCSALCAREHTYGGGGGEAYDSCLLDWGVGLRVGRCSLRRW